MKKIPYTKFNMEPLKVRAKSSILSNLAPQNQPELKLKKGTRSFEETLRLVEQVEKELENQTKGECENCSPRPHGSIKVTDINNPYCVDCGREITPSKPVEWEEKIKSYHRTREVAIILGRNELETKEIDFIRQNFISRKELEEILENNMDTLKTEYFYEGIGRDIEKLIKEQ